MENLYSKYTFGEIRSVKYLFTFIISIFILTGCQNEQEVFEDNETSREDAEKKFLILQKLRKTVQSPSL